MKKVKVLTAEEAAMLVKDGDTVATGGFVGSGNPESLTGALEKRFLETGKPEKLVLFHAAGQGNRDGSASDHFAHEGMLKRVIAGHYNMAPNLGQMIIDNKVEGYNLPQGVISQMYRDIAGHKSGTISHVGLNTYVDPRVEGGKLNAVTKEDIVELINIGGEERLLYKPVKIDVAFIRGSYADEAGNISLQREVTPLDAISMAQAARNSGGKVIVQVEKVVKAGTLDPKLVKIPGIYVDAVVVSKPEEHEQCVGCKYDPSLTGEVTAPEGAGSLRRIRSRHSSWNVDDDHTVFGDDRHDETTSTGSSDDH